MNECICNNCKNLKGIVNEQGDVDTLECEYEFPSEKCVDCEEDGCEYTCEHFENNADEVEIVVQCSKCGKELKVLSSNNEAGKIYCVDCYLSSL